MAQLSSSSSKVTSTTVYTVLSVSLVLFFLGILGMLFFLANKVSNHAKNNILITVLIKEDAKEKDVRKLKQKIENFDYSKSVELVSKEQAAETLEADLGEDFLTFLGFNPLSASLEIKLNPDFITVEKMGQISLELEKEAVAKEVVYQKPLIENIDKNFTKIGTVFFALAMLMYFVSVALINSTIRLTIHSKRLVIRTMRLIGATNNFIRRPFIISGIYQGLISSLLAFLMLSGVLLFIENEFGDIISLADIKMIVFVLAAIIIMGVMISFVSVSFAINRFLNARGDDIFFR